MLVYIISCALSSEGQEREVTKMQNLIFCILVAEIVFTAGERWNSKYHWRFEQGVKRSRGVGFSVDQFNLKAAGNVPEDILDTLREQPKTSTETRSGRSTESSNCDIITAVPKHLTFITRS